MANTAWSTVLFLLVIPLVVLVGTMVVRTHTTHYLLTGPPGSTADHLGPRIVDVLNMPTKLERFLQLNIVPDFVAKQSCGLQDIYQTIRPSWSRATFAAFDVDQIT